MREIVRDLRVYRHLLFQLVKRDIRIRYKQAVMGFAWAVFMPALVVLAGWVMRLAIAHLSGTKADGDALLGVAVKALPWSFFVGALGFGVASITSNLQLVTKVYFPRQVLPLAAVLAQLVDTVVGAAVLLIALAFVGVPVTPALFWAPLLLLLLVLLTAAAALLVSCANVFFRDVKYIVQVLLTFGIFFSPVFFDASALGERMTTVVMLNPLAGILEGLRLCVVEGHDLSRALVTPSGAAAWEPWWLAYSGAWAVGALVPVAVLFRRAEFTFAEYV